MNVLEIMKTFWCTHHFNVEKTQTWNRRFLPRTHV